MMQIAVFDKLEDWANAGANRVQDIVKGRPTPTLILPTGDTPTPVYAQLIKRYHRGELSFRQVTTFNLDEYLTLGPNHPQGYRYFMQKHFFDAIDIDPQNTHVPDGMAEDPQAACAAYERALTAAGEADLAVLGLGHNGHIGFNEPGSAFTTPTRVVEIEERTRQANARFFDSIREVPTHALTLGIAPIMRSRSVLLLVRGADKAEALRAALEGPVTPEMPASCLQQHPEVLVVADRAAAGLLRR